jgi:hypothetical protein
MIRYLSVSALSALVCSFALTACKEPTSLSECRVEADCNDWDACTADSCSSAGVCSHAGVATDDGDACTTDSCDPATGVKHVAVNSDDGDACTTDSCDPATGVAHTPVNTNDNDACTNDSCDAVTGVSHTPVNTDDNNVCTADACDPATGVMHTPVNVDDNNWCTDDACDPATGVSHTPKDASDGFSCTDDACNPFAQTITHTAVHARCDDGAACTTSDACVGQGGAVGTGCAYVTDDSMCDSLQICKPGGCVATGVLNETDTAAEADFCNLQFPASTTVSAGTPTPMIFGRIFEAGVTESAGPHPSVRAELGLGPTTADPRTDQGWVWSPASYNVQVGNEDEYQLMLIGPVPGTFSYTFRFSFDDGITWTYCDLDGAGSNPGLVFDPTQLGTLTVTS